MKVDNPLSREFLLHYPEEAARTLEQVSVEHVAVLFTELPTQQVVPVMSAMLPKTAAAIVEKLPAVTAAGLVAALPVSAAARIYRLLPGARQNEVAGLLPEKSFGSIRHYMMYPANSAGALLNSQIDVLPQNITIAEAIRRIERFEYTVNRAIYLIDDSHHLVGYIDPGSLLKSSHQTRLRDIMNRKTQPVSAHAATETLLMHPGWATRRRLPVVERDNTLLGILEYGRVRDSISEFKTTSSRDPLETMLSLASLYWLSLAQLMDGVLSTAKPEKRGRQ